MRKILPSAAFALFFGALFFSGSSNAQIANQMVLNHNNVSCILSDEGGFFNNSTAGVGGYEVPKGDSVYSIFAGSFMIGAQDPLGQIYFSGRKYSLGGSESSFHSGPIADPFYYGSAAYNLAYQNALWKVSAADIEWHQLNFQNPGYTVPNSLLKWPGNGDVTMGVAQQLAPYIDLNQNGIYEPVLGDYPDIRGDEAVYIIMNDASYQPDGNELQIELHVMFYQFSAGNYLNNTTFMHLKAINRSTINYFNYNQAIYLDYDLGNYSDDHIGCSPEKNMLFVYNGDDNDQTDTGQIGYGANPPCQALVSLSHPLKTGVVFTTGEDYFNSGDHALWLFMNSQWADTTTWLNPLTNLPTDFILPDNPNNPNGWSEEAVGMPAGDRRGMMTIYEPSFRPGTTICSDYAFIYSRVGSRLQNVQDVWNIAGSLHALYGASDQFPCQGNALVGSINDNTPKSFMRIFPNPASHSLNIESNFQTPFSIEIYNTLGQRVLQEQLQGLPNNLLSLQGLQKGCYVISASNGEHFFAEKLLIE